MTLTLYLAKKSKWWREFTCACIVSHPTCRDWARQNHIKASVVPFGSKFFAGTVFLPSPECIVRPFASFLPLPKDWFPLHLLEKTVNMLCAEVGMFLCTVLHSMCTIIVAKSECLVFSRMITEVIRKEEASVVTDYPYFPVFSLFSPTILIFTWNYQMKKKQKHQ